MSDKANRVANDATQLNRYRAPFVLDGAKLTRILTVIEERFGEADFEPSFDVTLKNGKQVKVSALDALLKLDNTIKNPVTSLDISAQSNDLGVGITFDDSEGENIQVGVRGSSPKIVGELFAELEEQVERTMANGLFWKLFGSRSMTLIPIILGMAFTILGGLSVLNIIKGGSQPAQMGLTQDAADQLRREVPKLVTTDDKINWLFDLHRKQLEPHEAGIAIDIRKLATWPNFFLALPAILLVVCLIYLARKCYPRTVFVWGDWEEHYKNIISKRRTVWGVVIGALVIGIISSLFVSSFQRFVPNK